MTENKILTAMMIAIDDILEQWYNKCHSVYNNYKDELEIMEAVWILLKAYARIHTEI